MENEYMFLFAYDDCERRRVTANGTTYTIAKESLEKLLSLIYSKGNEEEKKKAQNVDDKIACYVPDDVFNMTSDDELAKYVDEHFYDGKLLTPEPSREDITDLVFAELCNLTENDMAMQITDHIIDDVIEDINEAPDYPLFFGSDIRIAIGRALVKALENTKKPKQQDRIIRFD